MIQLIVGKQGTGKTKMLIEEVNAAAAKSDGNVVCIEYGRKLSYDIPYHTRLVDAKEYGITGADALYGFVCGMLATNYDITDLFIDSALKICGGDAVAFESFVSDLVKVAGTSNVKCVISASIDAEALPESLKGMVRANG